MQLPDESIEYRYASAILPPLEAWTPLAELQSQHLLPAERLEAIKSQMTNLRMQIVSERDLPIPQARSKQIEPGFIDLPTKLLDQHRRKAERSELGKILQLANQLKSTVDRVVILGMDGCSLGPRCLFEALCSTHHNELPTKTRMGVPRIYFQGGGLDNDSLQDFFDLLENTCVDPELMEERWGIVLLSKSGSALETAATYRVVRSEFKRFYGNDPNILHKLVIPVTASESVLRMLCLGDGFTEENMLILPDLVAESYSVFSPMGLLPAALMGLDIRALLLGASTMTKRFVEEPLERNPVLQFAAINHLMSEERGKRTRVLSIWSQKLEGLGRWYSHLVQESLGKQSRGPTPVTVVQPRDSQSANQILLEGGRDKLVHHLFVKQPKHPAIPIGMSDRNEDDLNAVSRKTFPDLLDASYRSFIQMEKDLARPMTELVMPALSEHTLGQLLQMLMLATVVEARLLGINPFTHPATDNARTLTRQLLRGTNNP